MSLGKIIGFAAQAALAYYTPTKADDVVVAAQALTLASGILAKSRLGKNAKIAQLAKQSQEIENQIKSLDAQVNQSEILSSRLEEVL